MERFWSRSPAHTQRIAKTILQHFLANKRRPIILALSGELGSGKTTFIQGLAQALGIRAKVQSPTFVLMKWYGLGEKFRPLRRLVHIDAYRLNRLSEARHLGLKEIFKDRDAIIVVEWAERIKKFVPRSALWIRFKHGRHSGQRIIETKNQK